MSSNHDSLQRVTPDAVLPGSSIDPSRRRFLQLAGFGLASAMMTGCSRGPERRALPYLSAPEGIVPGRAYWLATTCHGCAAACGVLAKCMDGRPIKLEGNSLHTLSKGGVCAPGQAEILSLYDARRFRMPRRGAEEIGWSTLDAEVGARLASAKERGAGVRLLTGTVHGPSTRAAIASFLAGQPNGKHVVYDALSVSALLEAHRRTHGRRILPSFHFDQAEVVVSFDADFLGTWISPVSYSADYAAGRTPDAAEGGRGTGRMSRHVQLEARMSLTGAAADRRIRLAPWETATTLAALCRELEERVGTASRLAAGSAPLFVSELVDELWAARGRALVVCGQNDLDAQLLAAYANHLLGSYGRTLSVGRPSQQAAGDDEAVQELKTELESGQVAVLVVSDVNPAYDLPGDFRAAISRAGTVVVHAAEDTETAELAHYVAPSAHYLEAWDDAEPERGRYALTQPALPAVRQVRTLRHLLAAWSGDARGDAELLREHWRSELHVRLAPEEDFDAFFDRALHDGFVEEAAAGHADEPRFDLGAVRDPAATGRPEELSIVLYPKIGIRDGSHAHNPWLQELPDPVTKVTWDNYASLSEARAEALGVEEGDVVRVTAYEISIELPVVVQRGQHDDVVAVALGYGRKGTDRFANIDPEWWEGKPTVREGEVIGVNAAPLLAIADGSLRYHAPAKIEPLDRHVDLASTQEHHTLEIPPHLAAYEGETRHAVRSVSLAAYVHDPVQAMETGHHVPAQELWPDDHPFTGHHWGMAVDLSRCFGCSACTISCQAENNVPVVGRDEVRRHREMHWMRIDRYLAGEGDDVTASYQPMFCQQCDNAPCESVCPVLATVHSDEGLNQQVYNRCVGTRYCANTCPYKVRRFNWFNYPRGDRLQNHALNPDVTIRTRGVMEKCTFCAQRIQQAKSEARSKGVTLADGDIQTACQQSCPTKAIVFGDLSDPESAVSKLTASHRAYRVLEEINVKPSVHYLARVRNAEIEEESHGG